MYFNYILFLSPNFWSRKWEFFIQKLTLKVCPFEKCISAFNHLRSKAKVFMSKVASLNTLLLDPLVSTFPEYVLPCSGIDSLGTKKKGKDDLHTCPNFPFPHFSSQKKKFWCIIKKCAESSDVSAGNTFLHIGEEDSYFIFPCNSSLNFHSLWVIMQMVNKGSC